MDILPVLEGLAYVGFIAGAIFAVIELRSISRDRKTELLYRSRELFISPEFEKAAVDAVKADFEPGKVPDDEMKMMADYFDTLGTMVRHKLADKKMATYMMSFESMWEVMKPWIDTWEERVGKGRFSDFEWLANEERKDRLAAEQKAKAVLPFR